MRAIRLVHEAYARANGYFWLPCPSCGEHFGGHEWLIDSSPRSTIPTPGAQQTESCTRGTGICPACTLDGVGDRAWAEIDLLRSDHA